MPHPHEGGGLSSIARGSTGSTSSGGLAERFKQNPLGVIGTALQSFIEGSQGKPISALGREADKSKREFERRRLAVLEQGAALSEEKFEDLKARNAKADERQDELDKRQATLDKEKKSLDDTKAALEASKFDETKGQNILGEKARQRLRARNERLDKRQAGQDELQQEQDERKAALDTAKFDEQKRATQSTEEARKISAGLEKRRTETGEAGEQRQGRTAEVDIESKRQKIVFSKVETLGRMVRLPHEQLGQQIELLKKEIKNDPEKKPALQGIVDQLQAAFDDPALQKNMIKLSEAMGQNPEQAKKLVAFCEGAEDTRQCMFDGEKALLARAKLAEPKAQKLVTLTDPQGVSRTYNLNDPAEAKAADLARERGAVETRFEGKAAELSPGGRVKLSAQRDFFQRNVELANRVLEIGKKNPSLFGIVGKVRKTGQAIAGALTDINLALTTDFVDPARQILEDSGIETSTFFDSPDLPELELLEISMGIALARLRTPLSQDRVLKVVIEESIKNIGLTKAKSAKDVLSNIENIRDQFRTAVSDINKRERQERPENKRLRFNVQGKQVQ